MCVFCLHIGVLYMPGALGGLKRHQIPWIRNYRCCKLSCGCWELNSGPPKEQVLLTVVPPLSRSTSPLAANMIFRGATDFPVQVHWLCDPCCALSPDIPNIMTKRLLQSQGNPAQRFPPAFDKNPKPSNQPNRQTNRPPETI